MKVYIINFALLVLIGLIAERFSKHKAVRILYCSYSWLQMTLIAALRWGNGIDFNSYHNIFYEISYTENWADLFQRREEVGFVIFNKLASYLTDNIIVYLFLFYGVMFGLLMFYVYKYSEIKWSTVVAFVAFDYFALSLCFMRQCMAMVIGLYAMESIKKRKWYGVLIFTFLAASFHESALILLVAWVFSYIDFTNRKVQIAAVVSAVLIYVFIDSILGHVLIGPFAKYADYLDSQFMRANHIVVVYYPIFVFGLAITFYKRIQEDDKEFKNVIPILFLGTLLGVMTTKHYIIERMSLYITIYNIRVVAQVLALFKNKMQKWYYQLSVGSAVLISIGAFVFGIRNDRYWIRPYTLNEHHLENVQFFKDIIPDKTEEQAN